MRGSTASVLVGGAAIISAGYVILAPWVSVLLPESVNTTLLFRLFGGAGAAPLITSAPLVMLGLVCAILYATLRFCLWWRACGGPGSTLLLVAAIAGLVPLLTPLLVGGMLRVFGLPDPLVPWLNWLETAVVSWGWLVQPIALLLLSLGILRAGIASRWVALIGVVAAISLAVALGIISSGSWSGDVVLLYVPETVFLVVLGISLIAGARQSPAVAV